MSQERVSEDFVASLTLFANAPGPVRTIVAEKAEMFEAEPERVLFDEKENSRHVYFVIDGKVRIFVTSEKGDVPLVDFERGSCFGELAALDGNLRTGKAVVVEPSALLMLDHETFNGLVEEYKEVANAVVRRLIEAIRRADLKVSELNSLSEPARLGRELLRISRPGSDGHSLEIPRIPSHAELSQKTGIPRDRVAEVMGWMHKEGIIGRHSSSLKTILIKDVDRMKTVAEVH